MNKLIVCKLSLIVLATGCMEATGLHDLPDAPLRPVLTQPFLDNVAADMPTVWNNMVTRVADRWNTGLVDAGCEPMFRVTLNEREPSYPVTLYTREEWPDGDKYSGMLHSGPLGNGYINVRTDAPFTNNAAVLAHEFGHALGLEHDEAEDSVMNSSVNVDLLSPTPRDIAKLCP